MRWAPVLAILAAGAACGAGEKEEGPPGRRFQLTDGRLFVPEGYRPGEGGVPLTLHLHGAAWAVERELVRAGRPGVMVSLVLPGLSSVYTQKFRDPAVFPRILEETRARLRETREDAEIGRVVVSSFSAGFGGVRELLRDRAAFDRIDTLVMADSIHAGFTGVPAARQVDPAAMEGFLRFAREAASGRKRMLVTHSGIRPDAYAGTTETADYLIRALDGEREPVSEGWPGGLLLQSRFQRKGFELYGFAGDTAADHMRHLHRLGAFLERLRGPGS